MISPIELSLAYLQITLQRLGDLLEAQICAVVADHLVGSFLQATLRLVHFGCQRRDSGCAAKG